MPEYTARSLNKQAIFLALSEFATPQLWRADLDARWPERLAMKTQLVKYLCDHLSEKSSSQVLELGIGDGELLLRLSKSLPELDLVAMDINQALLDHCSALMADRKFSPIRTDLSVSWSQGYENCFAAVYSLQSIHDFGGLAALTATYREMFLALAPGGIGVNADFVLPLPQDKADSPRRFPVETHLKILHACGFSKASARHQEGLLGLITAEKPN